MAISFNAAQGSNNGGGAGSITMTVPSGTADGDVMVMAVAVRGGVTPTATGPSYSSALTNINSAVSEDHIAYDGSYYVVTGYAGQIAYATSPGGTWTATTIGASSVGRFHRVAFGGGVWVVVGDANGANTEGLIYSCSGAPSGTWTKRTSSFGVNSPVYTVAYGNGYFVAGGEDGKIAYSSDGTTWTQRSNPFGGTVSIYAIIYADGYWLAGGDDGATAYATDPTGTWTSGPNTSTGAYGGFAYGTTVLGAKCWVVAGTSEVSWTTDPIGGSWTNVTGLGSNTIYVYYGNGLFLAYATATSTWTTNDPTTGAWDQHSGPSGGRGGALHDGTQWVITEGSGGQVYWTTNILAGWSFLSSSVSTTTIRQTAWWKVAASEPASYSVTFTSNKASGVIISISGVTSPGFLTSQYGSQANASSTSVTAPALGTWTSTDGIDVFHGGTAYGTTASPPTDYTEPANGESASTGGGANSRTTSEVAYRSLSAVTTVGSIAATFGNGAVNIGHHVFVTNRPAGTPAAPRVSRFTSYPQLLAH